MLPSIIFLTLLFTGPDIVGGLSHPRVVLCVVRFNADSCVVLSHSGGSFHIRGYEPILSLLLFVSALALHSRQLDLKLRLDFLWAVQVCACVFGLRILIFTLSRNMLA